MGTDDDGRNPSSGIAFSAYAPRDRRQCHRLLLLAGLLLAFAVRLYRLGAESLWYDETVSAFLARDPIPKLIAHTARDIHPPGYYLLLHFWAQAVQPSLVHGLEFLLAWPSLVWGMLLLPLIYAVARRLFNAPVALTALWLAVAHPYHIWYSQEVRMYTLGAGLGLICLWATLKWEGREEDKRQEGKAKSPNGWLIIYVLAAAVGLYTLYYFAFLLIALNLIVLGWILGRTTDDGRRTTNDRRSLVRSPLRLTSYASRITHHALRPWLLAQLAVLLLWAPWLPVFVRQISEPPVPPWRGRPDLLVVVQESLAALLVGQSPPSETLWPWTLLAGLVLFAALFGSTKRQHRRAPGLLAVYIFAPLLLIYIISLALTPLYHIRYFFTYAAPTPILLAVAVHNRATDHRPRLRALGLVALLLLQAGSLAQFWTNPAYRADDHRTAVAALARNWRPGDVILVNAGWVYTALDLYWPDELRTPEDSRPASQRLRFRLPDYARQAAEAVPREERSQPVVILQGGSVDGSKSLGWGLDASDFYAISTPATQDALATVASIHPRIWQYRLYDTVSDPDGVIRRWFANNTTQRLDQPYPGRDFLRVQLFETAAVNAPRNCPRTRGVAVPFGDALVLRGSRTRPGVQAGKYVYETLCWEAREDVQAYPSGLRTSLRLYRADPERDVLMAQQDAAPFPPPGEWRTGTLYPTQLALPLPASMPPGRYRLELIVYDGATGTALSIDHDQAIDGQRWPLSEGLEVGLPPAPPPVPAPLARFDYIELLDFTLDRPQARPGEALDLLLTWRPRPNAYVDTYHAVLTLQGEETYQAWVRPPGGPYYPSGAWPAAYPVREWERLVLAPDLPPGDYVLSVRLERARDGLRIPARTGPFPWPRRKQVNLATVRVEPGAGP